MKTLQRTIAAAIAASLLAFAPSALAGECCTKAAKQAKAGKACEKCLEHTCCKDSAKKASKEANAKACEKCAKKAEKK